MAQHRHDTETSIWILSGIVALFGIVGLFVAARAMAGTLPYWGGLALFAFAVLFVYYQIKRGYDRAAGHGDLNVPGGPKS